MNRDLSDLPGEGEQRDPVADFFARERADIRDLPAGTDRWESIVTEASRPRRRHVLPYLAGAAAVVLIGGVVWGTSRARPPTSPPTGPATRRRSPTVTVTETVQPTVTARPVGGASTAPEHAASQTPQPVPKHVRHRVDDQRRRQAPLRAGFGHLPEGRVHRGHRLGRRRRDLDDAGLLHRP